SPARADPRSLLLHHSLLIQPAGRLGPEPGRQGVSHMSTGTESRVAGDVTVEPQAADSLLDVRDLRVWFETPRGLIRAVDGVSLQVGRGETLGIVGESGSGKSVLSRAIMKILAPNARVLP